MPDFNALWGPALAGLMVIALLSAGAWVVCTLRRNASYLDRLWGLFFVAAALAYAAQIEAPGPRMPWVLALVAVWGVRLAAHSASTEV